MVGCCSKNGGNGRQRRGAITDTAINFANAEALVRRVDAMTDEEHGKVSAALLSKFTNEAMFKRVIVAGDRGRVKIAQGVAQSDMGTALNILNKILRQDTAAAFRKLN